MKLGKNFKNFIGLGFLIFIAASVLLLPVGAHNGGHTPGSGANNVYWDCDGSSCHTSLSAATISMSASKLNPQTNEQITLTVTVSGAEPNGAPLGIMLYRTQTGTITDLPSNDGWVLVTDPSGSTQFWYYEWASVTGGVSGTWTLNAPPTAGTFHIYAREHHGSPSGSIRFYKDYTTGLTFTVMSVANNPPEARALTVQGFATGTPGILHITNPAPTLGWTFTDPDGGDVQTQYQVRVGTGSGLNNMWGPAPVTSGASSVVYGGSALSANTDYWFGVQVHDGTEWSPWNETMFHMNSVEARGLTVQSFAPATAGIMHITNHTPYLNWTFWDGEADSQAWYQVRVGTAAGLSNMWAPAAQASPATSVIYAGAALLDGRDYWFGVRVNDSYGWSAWNETQFHMNSAEARGLTVQGFGPGTLGILHITNHTPVLGWTFFDNETDVQQQYEIRVGTGPGLSDMWALGPISSAATSEVYAGAPLVDGTDYWFGVRVYDAYEGSQWNETKFHMNNLSEAKDLTVNGFLGGSPGILHITGSSPVLGWTFFDLDVGDVQQRYRIRVGTSPGASDRWDSGNITSPINSVTYGGLPLADGTDYWFSVQVYDGFEWSLWNETMFHLNSPPQAMALTVQGYSTGTPGILHITFHTPDLGWLFFDLDAGDSQLQYQIRVGTSSGASDMWSYGPISGGASSEIYAGSTLVDGLDYWFGIMVNDSYEWGSWNETMFHMNTPPPAPIPPLSPPDDGNIPSSSAQTLSWTSGGADTEGDTITYWWYVDTDNPPLIPYVANGSTTSMSSSSFATTPSTDYYWYVNATDGWEWNTTVIWNFTTSSLVNNPPEAMDLMVSGFSPATSGILHILNHTPLLEWTFLDSDIGDTQQLYEIRIGTQPGFSDKWAYGPQAGPSGSEIYGGSVLLDGRDYYFGIRVFDGNTWSSWNETMFHMNSVEARSLTVEGFATGTAGIMHITNHFPDLGWFYFDGEVGDLQQEYEIRIGTQSGFSDMWAYGPVFGAAVSEIYAGAPLLDGTDYWFGIRVNDSYEWSSWNDTLFHMNALPPAPIPPLSPPDDANIPSSPAQTLSWTPNGTDIEGDTITYWWYVDIDNPPAMPYVANGTTTGTSSSSFSTSPATDYYWVVNVTDGWEWNYSIVWNFTTSSVINNPPEALDLLVSGFAPGTPGIMHMLNHTPILAWTFFDPDGGDIQQEYQIRVGTQSGFSDMWSYGPQSGTTSSEVYGGATLLDGTDYYFGISVFDGNTWSAWNETMFHMNSLPPAPIPPINPIQGDTVSASPAQTLSWTSGGADNEGDTVTCYWYIDTDNPPVFPYLANGTTTGTSSSSFATAPGTGYYWYVNTTDGWEWNTTIIWNFTTSGAANDPPEVRDLSVSGFFEGTSGILHITDHTPDLGWSFFDSNPGDFQQRYEIRVGTLQGLSDMWATGEQIGGVNSVVYDGSLLEDGKDYWFGILVFDGLDWSVVNETMFHMNTPPAAYNLTVAGFGEGLVEIMHLLNHTPELAWLFTDFEVGDTQIEYEIRVGTSSGATDMWAPGAQFGAITSVAYNGSTLMDGTDYYFGISLFDGYEWSAWNETMFHMNTPPPAATAPVQPLDDSHILASSTQTVSWTAGGPDTEGDTITYYWYVDTEFPFTLPYLAENLTTGTLSTAFATLPTSSYYWFVNATDGWEWSWSVVWNFTTQSPPNAPPSVGNLKVSGFSGGTQDIQHITDHTPELSWTFSDSDSGDSQVKYEIVVGTTPGGSNMWNPGPIDGAVTQVTYDGSALEDQKDYFFGIKVFDGKNWSALSVVQFHMNTPPEITELTVDGFLQGTSGIMNISSPSPVFGATYGDPDGSFTQQKYELRVGSSQGLSDVWAPGVSDGAFSDVPYAGPALSPGSVYWFGLRVFDGYEWSPWVDVRFRTNAQPVLDWAGDAGYENDGLDPQEGNLTTMFVFKVKYSDYEGHAPTIGSPKVHILKWGLEIEGSPFAMIYATGSNMTGAYYIYATILPEGDNYTYYFTASDILGQAALPTYEKDGPVVTADTVIPPPNPPVNVNVEFADERGVLTITWQKGEGDVAGYRIYRSEAPFDPANPGAFVLVKDMGAEATSYTDSGLEDKTTYYYLIKSYNSEGTESEFSLEAYRTTLQKPVEEKETDYTIWILLVIIIIVVVILLLLAATRRGKREEEEPLSQEEIYGTSKSDSPPSMDDTESEGIGEEAPSEELESGSSKEVETQSDEVI